MMIELNSWTFRVFTLCLNAVIISAQQPPLLLILSLDGFRHDFYDYYSTPNLHKIAEEGVRAPWINNVFPTDTLPNHFAIATGLYAESHGFVDNSYYDPVLNTVVDYYNEGETRFDIAGVPLWILNQEQNRGKLYSGGVTWPGTELVIRNQTAFHRMSRRETVKFADTSFGKKIELTISYFQNQTHPANVVFMYHPQPDSISHEHGPYSTQVRNEVSKVDHYVGDLVDALKDAGLYDRMNLIITGDHGQEEYTTDKVVALDTIVDRQLRVGESSRGSSMIWPVPNKTEEVYNLLKNSSWNKVAFDVYRKSDVPEEYHFSHNDRIAPIVTIARPGYELTDKQPPNIERKVVGVHGYSNTYHAMNSLFVARGPNFKRGYKSQPFDMVDIYPLMCHILGLQPAPNNGSLEAVRDLLKQETGNAHTAKQETGNVTTVKQDTARHEGRSSTKHKENSVAATEPKDRTTVTVTMDEEPVHPFKQKQDAIVTSIKQEEEEEEATVTFKPVTAQLEESNQTTALLPDDPDETAVNVNIIIVVFIILVLVCVVSGTVWFVVVRRPNNNNNNNNNKSTQKIQYALINKKEKRALIESDDEVGDWDFEKDKK